MARQNAGLSWVAMVALPACFSKPPAPGEGVDALVLPPSDCFVEMFNVDAPGCGSWALHGGTASTAAVRGSQLAMDLTPVGMGASSYCFTQPRQVTAAVVEIRTLFGGTNPLERTKIVVITTQGEYGVVIAGNGANPVLHSQCGPLQRSERTWSSTDDRFIRLRATSSKELAFETSPSGGSWRSIGVCAVPDGLAMAQFTIGADSALATAATATAAFDNVALCPK